MKVKKRQNDKRKEQKRDGIDYKAYEMIKDELFNSPRFFSLLLPLPCLASNYASMITVEVIRENDVSYNAPNLKSLLVGIHQAVWNCCLDCYILSLACSKETTEGIKLGDDELEALYEIINKRKELIFKRVESGGKDLMDTLIGLALFHMGEVESLLKEEGLEIERGRLIPAFSDLAAFSYFCGEFERTPEEFAPMLKKV